MDWDEFEFAVKKVCSYLNIDPESLLDEEGPRAAAPAENEERSVTRRPGLDTGNVKLVYKKKEEPQAPKPTGPVGQVNTHACKSVHK